MRTGSEAGRAAGRGTLRRAQGGLGWLVLGVCLGLAGVAWLGWVTWGAPADWTGASAVVRYRMPVLYVTVVAVVACWYRATRASTERPTR